MYAKHLKNIMENKNRLIVYVTIALTEECSPDKLKIDFQ